MQLKRATHKAIKYACMNYHYAKALPAVSVGYSVFNKKNEWCGCILFGGGANYKLGAKFGLVAGQFMELTRMALNGKQESTSKAMAIAIRLIKKQAPLVRMLFSYADKGQNHLGTIYQATNWYFIEESKSSGYEVLIAGEWRHDRILANKDRSKYLKRKKSGKYKYVFPLDKKLILECNKIKKKYPKNAIKV
tara:strand:+ start:261 stop:836 length:576 start_codon:yes stop_codon:yes gene_type:complete